MEKSGSITQRILRTRETGLLLVLLVIGVILTGATDTFLSVTNLLNVLKQATLVALIATSQTFIITSGGIDLSVGFVMGLCSILMCIVFNMGAPLPAAICVCILAGVFFGMLNGLLIVKLHLPPFIITLGMQYIAKGLINVITEGYTIMIDSPFIMKLGQGNLGPVPVMILFLPVIVLAMHFLYSHTTFGNYVKAIGGNEQATLLSGISVERMKVLIYGLNGLLCGIVGVLITGRLNAGNPNAGVNYDMNTIGAVIIGGTAISGGSGTVLGSALGAILLSVIRNGLTLLKVNMYWETVATGAIIILVCAFDYVTSRKRKQSV
ncbi:MAG: ABC transporter permease [Lachnospiraceae bacterium]|nr:ABC transporter permease [Lachnospiraceae bacterium]